MGGLGECSVPGMETVEFPDVEGDGDLPAGDGEGAGPPAFPGGPASGVQPPAAGGAEAGGQPPARDGAWGEISEDLADLPDLVASDDEDDNNPPPPIFGVRRSSRLARGVPAVRYDEVFEIAADFMSPPTVSVALGGEKGSEWASAVEAELDSLWENEVFEDVDRPKGKKVIGTKWVLRVKTGAEGRLEEY